jgi:hypothetical protein
MRTSGVQLTPEMWLVKLLMGSIDSSYDTKGKSPGFLVIANRIGADFFFTLQMRNKSKDLSIIIVRRSIWQISR